MSRFATDSRTRTCFFALLTLVGASKGGAIAVIVADIIRAEVLGGEKEGILKEGEQ